jgi:hypothetical protein
MRSVFALKSSEREIPPTALVGRFRGLHDVTAHLTDRLADIHAFWTEQRATYQQFDPWVKQTLAYLASTTPRLRSSASVAIETWNVSIRERVVRLRADHSRISGTCGYVRPRACGSE